MSKRCELTGISPLKGNNVSHAKNKTKRRFLPNLKKVIFKSDLLKKNIKLNVTNAALRTVDFKGGLDKFLLSAKKIKLSGKVRKLKASIASRVSLSKTTSAGNVDVPSEVINLSIRVALMAVVPLFLRI